MSQPQSGTADAWNPAQYDLFRAQRQAPFYDLLALVEAGAKEAAPRTAVDLGCGTGELTADLHRRLRLSATLGLDSSAKMLAKSPQDVAGLTFAPGDLQTWRAPTPVDVLFSNAAVQWCDDHPRLFAALVESVAPGGQLAVQMPTNHDHLSHRLATEVAREPEFAARLGGFERPTTVLPVERYAELLHRLGLRDINAYVRVYCHELPDVAAVALWVQGTLLTPYQARLDAAGYAAFVARYGQRLVAELGDQRPFFYGFKRLFLWARRPR